MKYGYEDGNQGNEAEFDQVHDTLFVSLKGSNHWSDYVLNFTAWPRKKVKGYRVHRWWYALAVDLVENLPVDWDTINIIVADGHSMGGAVVSLLPLVVRPGIIVKSSSVNAPKSGYTDPGHMALYDKGDIVRHLPFMYPKYKTTSEYAHTKPFWKAHNNKPDK